MKSIKQIINGKKYKLFIAKSKKDKSAGMNIFKTSPRKTGMIFLYRKEEANRSFVLSKTPFNLLVIFLNKNNKIVHQEIGKAKQKKSIVCNKPSIRVIEIPA
jgi:uncharacterized membrane protein (UPF0127 family)